MRGGVETPLLGIRFTPALSSIFFCKVNVKTYCFFAVNSIGFPRPPERVNLISLSEVIMPLYSCLIVFPRASKETTNERSLPLTLPSEICCSPAGVVTEPVRSLPACFKLNVTSWLPFRPGTCAIHFPVTSAADAANAKMPNRLKIQVFSCSKDGFAGSGRYKPLAARKAIKSTIRKE